MEAIMPNKSCQRLADSPTGVCGSPVSGGGNMHKKGHCPPPPRPGDNRKARRNKQNKPKKAGEMRITRGGPIAGTGKKGLGKRAKLKKDEEKN